MSIPFGVAVEVILSIQGKNYENMENQVHEVKNSMTQKYHIISFRKKRHQTLIALEEFNMNTYASSKQLFQICLIDTEKVYNYLGTYFNPTCIRIKHFYTNQKYK